MTTFLIIRHGQSQANLDDTFAGCGFDTPLTDLGRTQAAATGAYIAAHYKVDCVVASPLSRAYDTAKAAADRCGLPVVVDPELREVDGGRWERVKFADIDRDDHDAWVTWCTDNGHGYCPGGETVAQVQQRVVAALLRIAAEHDGQTVVLVSHATPVFVLQCAAMGMDLDNVHDVHYASNASVTTVECENGQLRLIEAGYDQHLGDLVTALPEDLLSE